MENLTKMDGNTVTEVENSLKRGYIKTAEKLTEAASETKSSVNKAMNSVKEYCSENPGKAIAIAAGVGAITTLALMKAFSRKESSGEKMISNLFRKAERTWNQMKNEIEPTLKRIKESVGE
jgi:ElaB/YqjD/DUF883 family membrane-anchored ribosome-binding protein